MVTVRHCFRHGLDGGQKQHLMIVMSESETSETKTSESGERSPEPAAPAPTSGGAESKPLTPAAQRALAEAAVRRAERERLAREAPPQPTELSGRGGLDPARYGDWEVKGISSDF
jgi:hypothetical protein